MILYFLLAIISSLLLYNGVEKNKKSLTFLSFLLIFLVSGLRYGIGVDYLKVYTPIFNGIVSGSMSYDGDYFNTLLIKIIGVFTKDSFYYFLITSFVTCFLFFKTIKEKSCIPWLSLMLFIISGCYIDSFNAIRQYIAIAIFINSFSYIIDKKLIKYIISIIIASLFHGSAIILIPLYFVFNTKLTDFKKVLLVFGIIFALLFGGNLINSIISMTKYSVYFNRDLYSSVNPSYSELIISTLFFVIASYFYSKNVDKSKNYDFFYKYLLLYFIFSILSFKIILSYRLIMYFKASVIFIIPEIVNLMKKPKNRFIFKLFCFIFFCSITYLGSYLFGWYDIKYRSIFNK